MYVVETALLLCHVLLWVAGALLAVCHLRGLETRRAIVALALVSVTGIVLSFVVRLADVAASRPSDSGSLAFAMGLAVALLWSRRNAAGSEAPEEGAQSK